MGGMGTAAGIAADVRPLLDRRGPPAARDGDRSAPAGRDGGADRGSGRRSNRRNVRPPRLRADAPVLRAPRLRVGRPSPGLLRAGRRPADLSQGRGPSAEELMSTWQELLKNRSIASLEAL